MKTGSRPASSHVESLDHQILRKISIPLVSRHNTELQASYDQERIWRRQQSAGQAPDAAPFEVLLVRDIDIRALTTAIREVISRHEVLRTNLRGSGGSVVQRINDVPECIVREEHLYVGHGCEMIDALTATVADEISAPFNLEKDPVIRIRLFALGPGEHALLIVTHHIAIDRWSSELLLAELAEFYDAQLSSRAPNLPTLDAQYADFAAWQRNRWESGALNSQAEFWKNQLQAATWEVGLPGKRGQKSVGPRAAEIVPLNIGNDLKMLIDDIARQQKCSPFMILLAAFHYGVSVDGGLTKVELPTLHGKAGRIAYCPGQAPSGGKVEELRICT